MVAEWKENVTSINHMANKYYDGSEKSSDSQKKTQTKKSLGKTIVEIGGSILSVALIVLGVSNSFKKK